MNEVASRLKEMADPAYKEFQSKLMPTVAPERIIGVRTPALRKFAAAFAKEEFAPAFLRELPHDYYEENNLHGMLLDKIKDYDTVIAELDRFLPYVDNWATCDTLSPKVLKKHKKELLKEIDRWLASDKVYTVRFAIEMLMSHYLDEDFSPEYPEKVAALRSEEYYINMMIAWYFATALAKQYEAVLPYIEDHHLERWTHNKAIQKAVESNRITPEQKQYLKTLKEK